MNLKVVFANFLELVCLWDCSNRDNQHRAGAVLAWNQGRPVTRTASVSGCHCADYHRGRKRKGGGWGGGKINRKNWVDLVAKDSSTP